MVFIKRSPNLGELGHPGSKPFSFAKHRKKPATPRTRISAQTSHSILICPPGAQGSYVNRSLSLQLQALSLECTLAGPMSLLPRGSFLPLPGPGGTARSLHLVVRGVLSAGPGVQGCLCPWDQQIFMAHVCTVLSE